MCDLARESTINVLLQLFLFDVFSIYSFVAYYIFYEFVYRFFFDFPPVVFHFFLIDNFSINAFIIIIFVPFVPGSVSLILLWQCFLTVTSREKGGPTSARAHTGTRALFQILRR